MLILPGVFGVGLRKRAFLVPFRLLAAHAHKVMPPFWVEVRLFFVLDSLGVVPLGGFIDLQERMLLTVQIACTLSTPRSLQLCSSSGG